MVNCKTYFTKFELFCNFYPSMIISMGTMKEVMAGSGDYEIVEFMEKI